jgi:hypothetical protein
VVAVTIQEADAGDTSTLKKTLAEAEARLDQVMRKPEFFDAIGGIEEAVLPNDLSRTRTRRAPCAAFTCADRAVPAVSSPGF